MDTHAHRAHHAWRRAQAVRQWSDEMIKIGPWSLGLDGALAWIPGVGSAYSLGAGGYLLYHAVQAGASKATLGKMAGWLAADSAFSAVPVAGWAMDTFFRGHRMAAKTLQKDIERRFGRPQVQTPETGPTVGPSAWSASARPRPMRNVTPR